MKSRQGRAVVAVIINEGRVLAIKRAGQVPGAGYWTPPAGKLEPGETQAEALVREVREELGLVVQPLREVWQCVADGADYELHWWLAEAVGGKLRPAAAEVAEARWVTPEAFGQLAPTFPKGRFFFEAILPALPEWQGLYGGKAC
ncbi:NUDIX hydrolase [Gallaecimonas kandeliae]|uniref:NUDIX hydrolase n=1 Tax=Gallaecimonas kandeliae TaxID=3029055 RepID=UPI0026483238|nr:NUDIX hydrolase [Gallaecimonas kandeliae]WKE67115.1 NUDIX hydrolase [Gallaecimonas kandeliae]